MLSETEKPLPLVGRGGSHLQPCVLRGRRFAAAPQDEEVLTGRHPNSLMLRCLPKAGLEARDALIPSSESLS
jgi:hypothetical protein